MKQCLTCGEAFTKRGVTCGAKCKGERERKLCAARQELRFAKLVPQLREILTDWHSGKVSKSRAFAACSILGAPRRIYERVAYDLALGR